MYSISIWSERFVKVIEKVVLYKKSFFPQTLRYWVVQFDKLFVFMDVIFLFVRIMCQYSPHRRQGLALALSCKTSTTALVVYEFHNLQCSNS